MQTGYWRSAAAPRPPRRPARAARKVLEKVSKHCTASHSGHWALGTESIHCRMTAEFARYQVCQTLDSALQEICGDCSSTGLGAAVLQARICGVCMLSRSPGYVPLRISAGEFHKIVKVEMSLDPSRYFCWILNHIDMFQTFEIQFLATTFERHAFLLL